MALYRQLMSDMSRYLKPGRQTCFSHFRACFRPVSHRVLYEYGDVCYGKSKKGGTTHGTRLTTQDKGCKTQNTMLLHQPPSEGNRGIPIYLGDEVGEANRTKWARRRQFVQSWRKIKWKVILFFSRSSRCIVKGRSCLSIIKANITPSHLWYFLKNFIIYSGSRFFALTFEGKKISIAPLIPTPITIL